MDGHPSYWQKHEDDQHQMSQKQADDFEKRASSMHISTGAYCKIILGEWLRSGRKMKLEEK